MKVVFEEITINEEVPEEYRFSEEDVKRYVIDELEGIKDLLPAMKGRNICVYRVDDITVEFSNYDGSRLYFIVVEYADAFVEGVRKRIEHAWGSVRVDGVG